LRTKSILGDDADRVNHDALALAELWGEVGEFAVEDREGDGRVWGPDEHADHLLDRHIAHIPVIDLEENVPDENSPACKTDRERIRKVVGGVSELNGWMDGWMDGETDGG